jgi:Cu/Ag efflux pump CusA
MMRWIVGSSLKFRLLVIAVALGGMVFGITQLDDMPADILPEFNSPMVEVQTEALGLSAEEVEQFVTAPLEQDLLNGVAFLDEIESESLPGLSSVVMTFEPGTDLLDARQVVAERLAQAVGAAGLPEVAKPPQMLQPLSSTSRVAIVKLSSNTVTPIQMSVWARWIVSPQLLGVEGVANVAIWGQRERQLQVLVEPERLQANGTSLNEIIRTTGNALEVSPLSFLEASTPGTGGFLDGPNQRLQIFHEQTISTPNELAQVTVEGGDGGALFVQGKPLTLGDVAKVRENHQPLIGDASCGPDPCLLLVVEKFPGANTLEVTEGIDEALTSLRQGLPGLEMDASVYRPAAYIESSYNNLGWALLIGAILLLLVIGTFFWDWRTGLISAMAIVLALVAAGLVLYFRGVTINSMILAGLVMALVVVIDDAVINVHNVTRRLRWRGEDGGPSAFRVVADATLEMRSPILFATLAIVAALLPFFFMQDAAGAFLPPIAWSFLLAVGASMVVALTVTPAMCLMLLSGSRGERKSPVVNWVLRGYDKVSSGIRRPRPVFLAFGVILLAGLAALPFLDSSLRPSLKEQDVLVTLEADPGTSLPRMDAVTDQAAAELAALPGVSEVGAHVGRAVMSDQRVNVNSGEIWAKVDPSSDYDATVAAIDDVVSGYDGLSHDVLTYSDERVTDVLQQSEDDLVVRVYGEDPELLRISAADVREVVTGIDGVERARVDLPTEEPTMEVQVDLARAQEFGIKPGDVRRAAATLLSGITVGNLFESQKVFDVVVWGTPELRQSEADVRNLLIDTPGGGQVRLDQVADVQIRPNPAVIRHESVSSYLDVIADVPGGDVGSVASDVDDALDQVAFPAEHHGELLQGYAEEQSARTRVLAIAIAAAAGFFLLLQAAFNSWRLAIISFVTIPMALVGSVLAVLITGATVSLGSIAGFLAVLALAARGCFVLISHYQHLERGEGRPFGPDLVIRGTRDRIAPILTTSLASVALFAPLVLAGNGPGLEIVQPMGIVILGGILTSLMLNLVVLPAAYLRFGFVAEPDRAGEELLLGARERDAVKR